MNTARAPKPAVRAIVKRNFGIGPNDATQDHYAHN